ncbi:hypothetical protein RHSIM_Rhsim08G0179100 [Rhododendron simsii]|uniref:Uncharacterized protein n=1 Tax=Rhododendron simsii TaxID=118357 RepID=A0A834LHS7_RHOSS|nr:hypothetical protein RHSIM_Rhsim08G0179100 [Rhododendron simsii]
MTKRGSREGERERERTETRIDGDDDQHLIAEPTEAIEVPFADLVPATGGFIAGNFLAVSDINFDISGQVMFGPNGNTTDIPNEREIDILGEKDTGRKNKHAFVMGVNQFLNRYLGPKLHSLAVSFCFVDAD